MHMITLELDIKLDFNINYILSFFCFVDLRKELPVNTMNESKRKIA